MLAIASKSSVFCPTFLILRNLCDVSTWRKLSHLCTWVTRILSLLESYPPGSTIDWSRCRSNHPSIHSRCFCLNHHIQKCDLKILTEVNNWAAQEARRIVMMVFKKLDAKLKKARRIVNQQKATTKPDPPFLTHWQFLFYLKKFCNLSILKNFATFSVLKNFATFSILKNCRDDCNTRLAKIATTQLSLCKIYAQS